MPRWRRAFSHGGPGKRCGSTSGVRATAATHALDHALWPDQPAFQHAQTLLWFAGTIWIVVLLYRRVQTSAWAAGLAGLVFVLDESHALPVEWLANRNALLGLFFGMVCLLAHMNWREAGDPRWLIGSLLCLGIAVHCNEGAIATTGYLFAYACFLDSGSWRARLLTLVPYAVLVVAWRAYYSALGFGVLGSATYVDPVGSPLRFLEQLFWRGPVLLGAQLANIPAVVFDFSSPGARIGHWLLAVLAACLLFWAAKKMFADRSTGRSARFWLVGMLLSLVPAVATFPTGRLLVFASVGGAALIAQYLVWASSEQQLGPRLLRGALLLLHLVIAPIALLAAGILFVVGSRTMASSYRAIEYPADIEERAMYLIDPPNFFLTTYANVFRDLNGLPTPRASHILSSNQPLPVVLTVTRVDEDTLHYVPEGGYPLPPVSRKQQAIRGWSTGYAWQPRSRSPTCR